MITTVTLNPMLDKTVHVDSLTRGRIHRARAMKMVTGGKGVNVSRQLTKLGVRTIATGYLGGETGAMIKKLLQAEGIDHDFVSTDGLTREGVTYLESDGTATAVFEPPGRVNGEAIEALNIKIEKLSARSAWLVCSGSSPSTETDEVFHQALMMAGKAGTRSVLDSYGAAFKRGLAARPTLIKPNKQEYAATFGMELSDERAVRKAMHDCIATGIKYVVITDGANPAYAASERGEWKIISPKIRKINAVGSGDAMVAGLLFGFEKGWGFEDCLAFGTAAGAANAQKWEVADSSFEEIERLRREVLVQKIT